MPPNAAEAAAIIGSHVRFDPSDGAAGWERLPDLPRSDELLDACETTDDLPWFPTIEHRWQKPKYLETLYKILRFEGIEGLRYSIKTLRSAPNMLDDENTCIYTKVCPSPPSSKIKLTKVDCIGTRPGISLYEDGSCCQSLLFNEAGWSSNQMEPVQETPDGQDRGSLDRLLQSRLPRRRCSPTAHRRWP